MSSTERFLAASLAMRAFGESQSPSRMTDSSNIGQDVPDLVERFRKTEWILASRLRQVLFAAAAALDLVAAETPLVSRAATLDALWPEPDTPPGRKQALKDLILGVLDAGPVGR